MPNITVEIGSATKEVKEKLIGRLTEAASEVSGIPKSSYTVLIKEFPIENWGIGGEPLEVVLKQNCH